MRLAFAILPLVAALLATPASAIGLLLPAVQAVIDGVEAPVTEFQVMQDGSFRGSLRFLACDGSELPAGAQLCDGSVLPNDLSLTVLGSVFPFIDITVSVVDSGAPTQFAISVFLPVSPIAGPADWMLEGSLTVPGTQGVPGVVSPGGTPSGDFIEGAVNNVLSLASLGALPVAQGVGTVVTPFGPTSGVLDCAPLGGCASMQLNLGFTGLGDGQQTSIQARLDLDPVAPIPLPASLPLLAAGLGLLGLLSRRSRAAA